MILLPLANSMDPTNSKAVAGLIAMGRSRNSSAGHNESAADISYASTASTTAVGGGASNAASSGSNSGAGGTTGLMGNSGGVSVVGGGGGGGDGDDTAEYVRFDDHVVIARSVPSSVEVESESETLWSDVEIEVNTS